MDASRIEGLLADAVASGVAPGLVAGVLRPGQPAAVFAAGVHGVADPRPMTPDSVFWIASCTKAVASAAALRLVEQGVLDLDAPVSDLLPVLKAPKVLTDGALRPATRAITLRHLLTHTSGLAYDFFSPALAAHYAKTGGSLFAEIATGPTLVFEPGESWQYGIGIDAAAWLIEAATGQPFADHMAEHVLGPLGMASSSFTPEGDLAARLVGQHRRSETGALEPADRFPAAPQLYGGGGLHSTVPDYLKFLRAVVTDGAGVFGPRALQGLREPQDHRGAAGELTAAAPPLSHDFRPMPGAPKAWTLGFLTNTADIPGRRRAGSLAWAGLANCYYWADPQSGVAGVLFGQLLPFADPRMLATFDAIEEAVYAG